MYSEFKNHEKSDKIKWIAVFVAIAVLFVGLAATIVSICIDKAPEETTETNEPILLPSADEKLEVAGGAVVETEGSSGIKLMSMRVDPTEYETYGITPLADSGYVITATVTPDTATNKILDLTFNWANPNSAWASGKAVGEYFMATKTSQNTWALSVNKAFGEQIILTVTTCNYIEGDTTPENLALKATCTVDYVKRVEKVTLSYNPVPMAFGDTSTISYDVTYSDGTIQGEFTASFVQLKLANGLYSAASNAITSGTYQKSQTAATFADLRSVSSQTVDVGAVTRFITATGNPGTGKSQWQNAFREYCVSHADFHAEISMDWDYTYQGYGSSSGTATQGVRFDTDAMAIMPTGVGFDQSNIIM